MFNNIKWLFFDVGSTLLDEHIAYEYRLQEIAIAANVPYEYVYDKALEFYKQNKKGDEEVTKLLGVEKPAWHREKEILFEGAKECLETLSKHYKIGVIANQSLGTKERLERHGILKYIDLVVASAEEGVVKPDRRIFEIALERSGCKPCEAVMIGDRIDNDIVPANLLGMHTIWVKQGFRQYWNFTEEIERADYTVNNLWEVCEIIVNESTSEMSECKSNLKIDYSEKLRELLSLEFNCKPTDFVREENILTVSELHEGRRIYFPEKYFFHMVTTGGNAVVTADECLHPFLRKFIKDRTGHWLFEIPNLLPLEAELNRFGYTLTQTHHMFLADKDVAIQREYPVKWFYDEEIHPFYGDERFPNAICPQFTATRPDRIVVCAYDGDEIMGMAGCSEDAPGWQQIGIDVMPKYRSKGVGTYLVTLLKNEIIRQGDIPFYGTSVSNYHSWNIALNSGFKPVWVEIGAQKKPM